MRTLYLQNVPADVVERLERLAAGEGVSVNSLAVRELIATSRRGDPRAPAAVPGLGLEPADIVADLQAARVVR